MWSAAAVLPLCKAQAWLAHSKIGVAAVQAGLGQNDEPMEKVFSALIQKTLGIYGRK